MNKSTVIFIHGMWDGPGVWGDYKKHFEANGFKTLAPALKHHDVKIGDPPPEGLGTTSLTDYADGIVDLVNSLDHPPIIVAHSLGGLVAQLVAARCKLACVVALCPAPPAGIFALRFSTLKIFGRISLTWAYWRKPTFPTYKEMRYGVFNRISEADAQKGFQNCLWGSGLALFEIGNWAFDKTKASRVDVDKISCPVLIFGAQYDHIVPASLCRAAAKRYPAGACEYVELPDHAHWVLGEDGWEKIADRCIDWIKSKVEKPTV